MPLSDQIGTLQRLLLGHRRKDGALVIPAALVDDMDELLTTFVARARKLESGRPGPDFDGAIHAGGNVVPFRGGHKATGGAA